MIEQTMGSLPPRVKRPGCAAAHRPVEDGGWEDMQVSRRPACSRGASPRCHGTGQACGAGREGDGRGFLLGGRDHV